VWQNQSPEGTSVSRGFIQYIWNPWSHLHFVHQKTKEV
jgi:hypothetical protein